MGVDAVDRHRAGHRCAGQACQMSIKKTARGRGRSGTEHGSCGFGSNPSHVGLRAHRRNPNAVEQRASQDFQHILWQSLEG